MLEHIKKHYEENEPIFISDLCDFNPNMNIVRKAVKKLTTTGELKRYDTGVYFMPSDPDAELDIRMVVERKYLSNQESVFGYTFCGKLADELKLIYKFPPGYKQNEFDVVSNKASTEYRELKIGGHNVTLRKSRVEINKENYKVLQFLDFIKDLYIEEYKSPQKEVTVMLAEIEKKDNSFRTMQSKKLLLYMLKEDITLESINKYLEYFNGRVARNLYLLGFLQVPTQKDLLAKFYPDGLDDEILDIINHKVAQGKL